MSLSYCCCALASRSLIFSSFANTHPRWARAFVLAVATDSFALRDLGSSFSPASFWLAGLGCLSESVGNRAALFAGTTATDVTGGASAGTGVTTSGVTMLGEVGAAVRSALRLCAVVFS